MNMKIWIVNFANVDPLNRAYQDNKFNAKLPRLHSTSQCRPHHWSARQQLITLMGQTTAYHIEVPDNSYSHKTIDYRTIKYHLKQAYGMMVGRWFSHPNRTPAILKLCQVKKQKLPILQESSSILQTKIKGQWYQFPRFSTHFCKHKWGASKIVSLPRSGWILKNNQKWFFWGGLVWSKWSAC